MKACSPPLEILQTHVEKLDSLRSMDYQQDQTFFKLKGRLWGGGKTYKESLNQRKKVISCE